MESMASLEGTASPEGTVVEGMAMGDAGLDAGLVKDLNACTLSAQF